MRLKIDLHMHSRYSEDGEYAPVELVERCSAQDIRIMSVTDHNCAGANLEAQAAAVIITERRSHPLKLENMDA